MNGYHGLSPAQLAFALIVLVFLCGCTTTANEDLNAWIGQPVSELDKHPVFLIFPVLRTTAADGTEIRDYVNGHNFEACFAGRTEFPDPVDFWRHALVLRTAYRNFPHGQNIFYIKDGLVERVSATSTGGARCDPNESLRPGFLESANGQ